MEKLPLLEVHRNMRTSNLFSIYHVLHTTCGQSNEFQNDSIPTLQYRTMPTSPGLNFCPESQMLLYGKKYSHWLHAIIGVDAHGFIHENVYMFTAPASAETKLVSLYQLVRG